MKCRKNTESKKTKSYKKKLGRIMSSSNCAVFCSKKSSFSKEQEGYRLLCSLGVIILILSKLSIAGNIFLKGIKRIK